MLAGLEPLKCGSECEGPGHGRITADKYVSYDFLESPMATGHFELSLVSIADAEQGWRSEELASYPGRMADAEAPWNSEGSTSSIGLTCIEVCGGEREGERGTVLLVDSQQRLCKVRLCGGGVAVLPWNKVKVVSGEEAQIWYSSATARSSRGGSARASTRASTRDSQDSVSIASRSQTPSRRGSASSSSADAPLAPESTVAIVGGAHHGLSGRVLTVDYSSMKYKVRLSSGEIRRISFCDTAPKDEDVSADRCNFIPDLSRALEPE